MSRTYLVLAALFGLGLAGLSVRAAETSTRAAPSAEPPSLWSIDTSESGGPAKRQLICAGAVIRQGLGRALPEANGAHCRLIDQAQTPAGVFTGRCRLGEDLFSVHSVTSGDVGHDFSVRSEMQSAANPDKQFVSTQRYRQVQASCPAGWDDGDTGFPGDVQLVNSLTGVAHAVSPPVPRR